MAIQLSTTVRNARLDQILNTSLIDETNVRDTLTVILKDSILKANVESSKLSAVFKNSTLRSALNDSLLTKQI